LKENYLFQSKSEVLKFLKTRLQKSKIEDLLDFSVKAWKDDKVKILNKIQKRFKSKIIVRSSAKGEDSKETSEAGRYESILDVNPKSKSELTNAINFVIRSYQESGNIDENNLILIQNQTDNIYMSGVIFTKTPDNGSPYYTINYEEGSSTVGVTSGKVNNIIKIFRKTSSTIPNKLKPLIESITEIESILNNDLLDIEFGITKTQQIVIFQVRPITSIKTETNFISDNKIKNLINENKKKFSKLSQPNHLHGKYNIFSDMTDWNPAEIIGNNPNLLDYSLYNYLIMQKAWHAGRTIIGYQDVEPAPLMAKFGNKPYVNVRASFNSLLPNNIPKRLSQKLINFYLKKLKNKQYLQDKVEFEILFTCYDLDLPYRLKELSNEFTKTEIKLINDSLITFTNKIICDFPDIIEKSKKNLTKMKKNRYTIISNLNDKHNYKVYLHSAEKLLKDCRQLATIEFSTMARLAFIGTALLRSLKNQNKITSYYYDSFMNSIQTPLTKLRSDFMDFYNLKIHRSQFFKKYGHLRPGTYDITALRYDKENPYFKNIKYIALNEFELTNKFKLEKLSFDDHLEFRNINFSYFVKETLSQRENLKFEFTRNLSDAIEFIAEAGRQIGFSRLDMANLSITYILNSYKNHQKRKLKTLWKNKIEKQRQRKKIGNYLVLPPLITDEKDFEIISYFSSKPNFVTQKSVTGSLHNLNEKQETNLENKIILLENADPGYDWIFTKNPMALITKYGGVASHMSIRCAEIGLPAAIGCGEIIFERLLSGKKVLLDCENEQIVILKHESYNNEVEVKKILKSIGYIK